MFAPLSVYFNWSNGIDLLVSFIIGIGFGFALEQGGFGNSRKLAMQFYFRDLTVLKVMFSAMVTAMTGIVFFSAFGWLDTNSMFIPQTFIWAQILGCAIMGVGFAIGGYCPGTSFVGLSTLKMDALFFIIGLFIGVFLFGEMFPILEELYHGKYSGNMGRITLYEFLGVRPGIIAAIILIVAIGAFWGSEKIEEKFGNQIIQ
jgi:hypothetical protein